jgi:hypothetical protein
LLLRATGEFRKCEGILGFTVYTELPLPVMPLRRHRLLKANPLVRPHYLVVAADVEGGGADGSTVVIVAVEQ